jgi:hypothetical protein
MEIISTPFHIRDAGVEVRGPGPDAGEHTREVFAEAGIPKEHIEELITKGVPHSDVKHRSSVCVGKLGSHFRAS